MEQKEKTSPISGSSMFDPAKTSPVPGSNLFDPTTLLGASPFAAGMSALPFAHLAHLPGAFSMLGHPAFPVSSLFGRLGDGITSPLGISSSLATSLSPTSAKYGMFGSSLGFTSSPTSSSKTTTLSSTAGSSHTSTSSRGRRSTNGGRGRPRKLVKQPAIPLSLVQSTSILSPSMLEKYAKKESSTSNGLDSEAHSDRSSVSSLFDINFDKDAAKPKKSSPSPKAESNRTPSTSPSRRSPSKPVASSSAASTPPPDKVHIDSLKKKLIADQIRHRMQTKNSGTSETGSSSPPPSGRKRRGRPPRISQENYMSAQELGEEEKRQERLKRELELELKQQEIALKMIKSAGNEKISKGTKLNSVHGDKTVGKTGVRRRSPNKIADKLKMMAELAAKNGGDDAQSADTGEEQEPGTSKDASASDDGDQMSKVKDMFHDTNSNGSSALDSNDIENGSLSGSEMDNTGDSDSDDNGKRKADSDGGERPIKRRHVVLDDDKIKIPLSKGWKRQTNIHSYGRRGIVGEVWYFAPCGRKMKTIPDVMRYIERNNVQDLGRDLFSFNTKVNVGDFYEARVGGGENGFVKLSESEIKDRLSVTVSRRLKKIENQKKREKLKMQQIMARQMIENKMKQKLEQQEMARKVAEMQFQKRLEREQQKELLKRAKQMKILEKKKQREQMRVLRERERQQRDEQLRMKQEMRAHQLLEKRRQKQEDQQRKKYIKAMKRVEWNGRQPCEFLSMAVAPSSSPYGNEREMKRQQVAMLKEQMRLRQEQERRRQHMLLLKALEQRKKQEERERQREERIAEKRMHRERKNEQRKMEFVLAQELKKPREDMELRDFRPMPEFSRIPGNHLDGEAFADCLMSLEFLHNFSKALGFDSQTLPTLKSLQDAVLAKTEEDSEEYMSLVTHLLRHALDEPGVPNPKEAVTKLGQKITDIEITDVILAEVLRVFMVIRNGGETELSEYLRNYPLEACSVNQRAAVVAFLCNELNCGKTITTEIENHLDHMADIRRDKWVIEGKLRRLRILRSKKFNKVIAKPNGGEGEGDDSIMTSISKQSDDEEDKDEGSGNEEENFNEGETEEDDPTTLEECEKQIEKLRKQHVQYRDKVFKESQHVRGIDLGRDRYKRNYWVLPHAGGVFIEGMESGEIKDLVKVRVKNDRSEAKNLKIEVIDERSEKKGFAFLEEIEEKKAAGIRKHKSENGCENKSVLVNGGKEIKNEVKDISEIKEEKPEIVKSENTDSVKSEDTKLGNGVKAEQDTISKSEIESPKLNGHVDQLAVSDTHVKTCESLEKVVKNSDIIQDSLCNGDIRSSDQNSPQCMSVSGSNKTGSNKLSKNETGTSKNSYHETGTGNSSSSEIETIKSSNNGMNTSKIPSKHVELKIPSVKSSAIEKEKSTDVENQSNLFLQIPQSTKLSDFCSMSIDAAIKSNSSKETDQQQNPSTSLSSSLFLNTSFPDHVTKSANHLPSLSSPPQPPPAHSKTNLSERKPSFMSIDSILEKKTGSSQSNQFYPNSVLPVNPFVTQNQSVRSVSDSHTADSKPWFSLLPRVPCDDMSLTRGQHTSISSGIILSPPFMSQLPFHPFSIQSPSFSSFQMGQLFNTSTDQALTVTSSSTTAVTTVTQSSDSSFKKPEPVSSSQNPDPEQVLKSLQGEAKPIPEEYKKGWWKINEAEQFSQLQKCLHPRGIREKSLQKTIQKFQDYTLTSCSKAKEVICMDSSSEEEVTDDEEEAEDKPEEQEESENNDNQEQKIEKSDETSEKNSIENTTDTNNEHSCDKQTENCEKESEKENNSEDLSNKKCDKTKGRKKGKNKKEKQVKKRRKKKKAIPVIDCKAKSEEADRLILEEVETLEDRIATASLQIKGWKLAPKTFSEESEVRIIPRGEMKKDENDLYPVEAAKERLLQLESNVERRYLKPPLSKAHRISLNSMSTPSHTEATDDPDSEIDFENLPVGLQMWRIAVATATSPAQLMLCIIQLNNSLAWEKSIMKVLCQICRKDDNEAELLLCDGCDRGYHTYCFKPKLETIPDGDWYCFECVSKALGESCCLVCGRRFGKMADCNMCNRSVHIDCLDPPLPRIPRKWFCASCDDCTKSSAKKRVRKNSTASASAPSTPVPDLTPTGRKRRSDFGVPRKRKASDAQSESDSPPKKKEDSPSEKSANVEKQTDKLSDKEKMKIEEQSTDLKICRLLHTEMMKHEDGWPFLQPVSCKHFPSYRKYIKYPMDFGTMKIKLRDHIYQSRSEFVNDAKLTFDNCQLFNEDDSEVGQCGHNMRKFFNRRWKELVLESMSQST
ncbi:bromodomain adjacent to zinc finger domain protein 2B-like isoform X2 [Mercenaria mercenaria]|uniref:bromodomain adjacent to zinc finger domain protein 2B-like isoform X2 n=1 Tax=Mercenaria mercenaria TaxID=6596 RepID=UPI00234FAD83|nr:bromodomain adjacent to zinc finger domain protein 2B-like isoform X2 [Mercenaria mercenaria]